MQTLTCDLCPFKGAPFLINAHRKLSQSAVVQFCSGKMSDQYDSGDSSEDVPTEDGTAETAGVGQEAVEEPRQASLNEEDLPPPSPESSDGEDDDEEEASEGEERAGEGESAAGGERESSSEDEEEADGSVDTTADSERLSEEKAGKGEFICSWETCSTHYRL